MEEHELKQIFVDSIFPSYKLFVISNHDLSLGDMIDIITKKESCINKLYTMKNFEVASPIQSTTNHLKVEANTVTHKKRGNPPPKPTRHYTHLTNTVNNILNIFLDEDLIDLPSIV